MRQPHAQPPLRRPARWAIAGGFILCLLAGCGGRAPEESRDVIVIGAGIAGISAALEAAAHGATVTVVERASVAGGHAVKAGGFALVDTALQRARGLEDSADIASADLLRWGEDADADRVRRYASESARDVFDWLVERGVEFTVVLDTPEDSVPRFHFTRGTAIHVVVPLLRKAFDHPRIDFAFNTIARELIMSGERVTGVRVVDATSADERILRGAAVIIATGGFQSDLRQVRTFWPEDRPVPEKLLVGSARHADGAGLRLAEGAGAQLGDLTRQATFINGLPNPRAPKRALNVQNPAAIWVNADGRRFVAESAPAKTTEAALFTQQPMFHWLVFDANGRKRLRVRGAAWLTSSTIESEVLDGKFARRADSLRSLAVAMGVPALALQHTVERYNRHVVVGTDLDFARFTPTSADRQAIAIDTPPYFALQLFPMTRKSLGGIATDADGRAIETSGDPVDGLFAAGEVTGVGGINGLHGQSGTFLGPSVWQGRIAGRQAAAAISRESGRDDVIDASAMNHDATDDDAIGVTMTADDLARRLDAADESAWHFRVSHELVRERESPCASCHSVDLPTAPVMSRRQRIAQLDTCTSCH